MHDRASIERTICACQTPGSPCSRAAASRSEGINQPRAKACSYTRSLKGEFRGSRTASHAANHRELKFIRTSFAIAASATACTSCQPSLGPTAESMLVGKLAWWKSPACSVSRVRKSGCSGVSQRPSARSRPPTYATRRRGKRAPKGTLAIPSAGIAARGTSASTMTAFWWCVNTSRVVNKRCFTAATDAEPLERSPVELSST
mmetsp:Transcript_2334/g.6308  ORF Transcript_2334/g.6308 Transcript_2334/m.6308 type:complete len:203 (+) Transcript_2334:2504-3112(+)